MRSAGCLTAVWRIEFAGTNTTFECAGPGFGEIMTAQNEIRPPETVLSTDAVRAIGPGGSSETIGEWEPETGDDRMTQAYRQSLRIALDRWETDGGTARDFAARVSVAR